MSTQTTIAIDVIKRSLERECDPSVECITEKEPPGIDPLFEPFGYAYKDNIPSPIKNWAKSRDCLIVLLGNGYCPPNPDDFSVIPVQHPRSLLRLQPCLMVRGALNFNLSIIDHVVDPDDLPSRLSIASIDIQRNLSFFPFIEHQDSRFLIEVLSTACCPTEWHLDSSNDYQIILKAKGVMPAFDWDNFPGVFSTSEGDKYYDGLVIQLPPLPTSPSPQNTFVPLNTSTMLNVTPPPTQNSNGYQVFDSQPATPASKPQITATVETITPEIAQQYLDRNIENNRRINSRRVTDYSNKMRAGRWALANTICFDVNGRLQDGQHRMNAVVRAGIPIQFVVVRGFPPGAVQYIDLGQKRSALNIASVKGMKTDGFALSTSRAMLIPRFGCNSWDPNNADSLLSVAIYQAFQDSINLATKGVSDIKRSDIAAVIARAHIAGEDAGRLSEFIQVLQTGYPVSESYADDGAAIALRNYYLRAKDARGLSGAGTNRVRLFEFTQSAVSAFLKRRDTRHLNRTKRNLWKIPQLDTGDLNAIFELAKALSPSA